ncbi:sucrose phosphorylase [Candidatus Phytoplasma ziziphi]|uniref:Sucrose phosphorylase n=1 Tax=Ziziphus jujuba witches'-broom phytoplasma TaxID=135727 RepID=A0A660HN14_ZIZJU|nr:sucrose phosphorylase [Candidatus Phytoplasma ziziphi]AYJ01440.1 sucrose phosphorylase [Candidatus Phytoplasma ziziphi]
MKIKNKAMLITYPDSLGKNLKDLIKVLKEDFGDSIGGIHILPFFPSTSDRGFSPSGYDNVDSAFGNRKDIENLSEKYYLMFDFMINHISRESVMYKDFQENHDNSKYNNFFIRWEKFWAQKEDKKPTPEDIDLIYKRKNKAPIHSITFKDGTEEKLWNTFGEDQIDINISDVVAKQFIKKTLVDMASHGASLIRLDAFAYACKKINTNCFFVEPEIWNLLKEVDNILKPLEVEILPEIHEHYTISDKISKHGYFIYDFVLPLVMLYTLYSGKVKTLADWLRRSPMKQFTTLDVHDGIGVVDARGILTDEEIDYTSEKLYKIGANVKKIYSSDSYNNLDIYQINTTYYSALGNDDDAYLLARAFQIFAPGIPQIYYVGLLAGENDIKLLESSKEGRNINRHYYSLEEIKSQVQRPVVKNLLKLLSWRNECPAFDLDGEIIIETDSQENKIKIIRKNKLGTSIACLTADAKNKTFVITENDQKILDNLK